MNEDGSTLKRIMYTSPHAKQKDICPQFQNQIAKLTNLLHYGDFCVCGRKPTDNEYNHMINTEVENAENRVSGIFKGLEVDRYCCKQLVKRKVLLIKLLIR